MSWLGHERVHHEVCGSTNDEAMELARRGVPHGTIVIADAQRSGRGRSDHRWHSPAGENLYLSCILRPDMEPSGVPPITLAAGLGVVGAVNSLTVTASLKWPNDVLVGKKKLAGILTEMSSRANTVDHVVVGIGVNLNTISFPDELAAIATSLRIESGDQVDRARFTESLLGHLEAWLDRFFAGGVGAIADDWTAHADLASHRVRAGVGRHTVSGVATGLDADGALCVRDDAGKIHRVVAGDVILLAKGAIGS